MPDTNEGVLDSTTNDSADLDLIDQEDVIAPRPEPEPEELSADETEEKIEAKEKEEGKEEEEKEPTDKRPPFPYDRPTMQQLRDAFPDLFKKFPVLRDIYFREQEFSTIFPTIDDAKEAAANAQAFDDLSGKVMSGDSTALFTAIKAADEKALEKIVPEMLPSLYKISPELHWKATIPLMQSIVRSFYVEGERSKNENQMNAAQYLSDFLFNDVGVAKGEKNLVPPKAEKSEEQKKFEAEKAKFENDKYVSFFSKARNEANETLRNIVLEKDKNDNLKIDPDGIFSEFIRETITSKVIQEVEKQLIADRSHMQYMNSLWDRAKKEGYSDEWKSRILSAYLARAKSLIPSIRARFVSEARGTSSRAAGRSKEIAERNSARREPGKGGAVRTTSNGTIDARKVDWDRTSDMDLLDDNVTYKQ